MVFMGLFAAAAIAFDGPVSFSDAVGIAVALFLAAAGVSLTADTFFRKK